MRNRFVQLNVDEAKPIEVKPVDKRVDSPHRIVLSYVLIKTRRESPDAGIAPTITAGAKIKSP
jgi:hypothetical protein